MKKGFKMCIMAALLLCTFFLVRKYLGYNNRGVKQVYYRAFFFDSNFWRRENELEYNFVLNDKNVLYQFDIELIYNNEYRYSNIYLYYDIVLDENNCVPNSIENTHYSANDLPSESNAKQESSTKGEKKYILFDIERGTPSGSKKLFSKDLEVIFPLCKDFKVDNVGKYKIKLKHLMRDIDLNGIKGVVVIVTSNKRNV